MPSASLDIKKNSFKHHLAERLHEACMRYAHRKENIVENLAVRGIQNFTPVSTKITSTVGIISKETAAASVGN